jgi:SAM-dependent methyltransferase
MLTGSKCLRLSIDPAIDPSWFLELLTPSERSPSAPVLALPSSCCGWVYASQNICGAVDEQSALQDMLRVAGSGFLVLIDGDDATAAQVPRSLGDARTRARGAQYGDALRTMLPDAAVLELVALDASSLTLDCVFVVSRDAQQLLQMAKALSARNIHAHLFESSSAAIAGSAQAAFTAEATKPSPIAALQASLPVEFDEVIYRSLHADLASFSERALRDHYERHGRREGRRAHAISDRRAFANLLSPELDVLEIGPLHDPLLSGPRVRYFDLGDKPTLIARAAAIGYSTHRVPDVHYVSPTADLGCVKETFDAVLSSHVIEHQPDLVGHLDSVRRLLRPGGLYFLLVPDKNYCFDHFMALSTIAELLDAHVAGRTRHTLRSEIANKALVTHNDPKRHWSGDHGAGLPSVPAVARVIEEHLNSDGSYVDCHAWYFEPTTFRDSLELLRQLGEMDFSIARLYPTQNNTNEFWAILQAVGGGS